MIENYIFTIILLFICTLFFGLGVLFFNKTATKDSCSIPTEDDSCTSQKIGVCPFDDDLGALKMQKNNRVNYHKRDIKK